MHPSTKAILRYFKYEHLSPPLRVVSKLFADVADALVNDLSLDGPELTMALRKLLEAKDCAVRAALPAPDPEPERLSAKCENCGLSFGQHGAPEPLCPDGNQWHPENTFVPEDPEPVGE